MRKALTYTASLMLAMLVAWYVGHLHHDIRVLREAAEQAQERLDALEAPPAAPLDWASLNDDRT